MRSDFLLGGGYSLRADAPSESVFLNSMTSYLVGLPAVTVVVGFILYAMKAMVRNLRYRLDESDVKICIAAGATLFAIMIILLGTNSSWYTQYDKVLSLDSGWCMNSILPKVDYYDIRHPLLSSIAFPIYSTVVGVAKVAVPVQVQIAFCAISIQFLNICMLVAIGAMLKALSGNRGCLVLYFAVFSTLLSAVAPEKHVLACFLVVGTIYLLAFHPKFVPLGYVLAIGVMPTNVVLLLAEMLRKDSLKAKMKRLALTAGVGLLAIICSGHGTLLNLPETIGQIELMHSKFGNVETGHMGKVYSFLNLIQGSLLPLDAEAQDAVYAWPDLTASVALLSVPILLVMCVGFIRKRNEFAARIACFWVVFAFVLFAGFSWAPHESALFAPLFSWAILLLFSEGLYFISSALRLPVRWVIGGIAFVCFSVGFIELLNMNEFMLVNL